MGRRSGVGMRSDGAEDVDPEALLTFDAEPAPELPWPPVPVPPYQPAGALVSEGGGYWVCGPGGQT